MYCMLFFCTKNKITMQNKQVSIIGFIAKYFRKAHVSSCLVVLLSCFGNINIANELSIIYGGL